MARLSDFLFKEPISKIKFLEEVIFYKDSKSKFFFWGGGGGEKGGGVE